MKNDKKFYNLSKHPVLTNLESQSISLRSRCCDLVQTKK